MTAADEDGMKYTLTPKNEGQEFPCRVMLNCSKREALKVAGQIAAKVQAALLRQCDISVHVQTKSQGFRGEEGIHAWPDGRFVDAGTGDFVKNTARQSKLR